jgi:hypothetical protein
MAKHAKPCAFAREEKHVVSQKVEPGAQKGD